MMGAEQLIEERLQQLAQDYRNRGYQVLVRPNPEFVGLPEGTEPDLVAIGPSERVVVEIKSRRTLRSDLSVKRIADWVQKTPGWRAELVVANPLTAEEEPVPEAAPLSSVEARAAEARNLVAADHVEAALLIAWAALEAALRERGEIPGTRDRATVALKEMYAGGVLSDRQFELADSAAQLRSAVSHGLSAHVDAEMVERVARLAEKLADPSYASTDQMVEWFFENYEDPANGVPYDSAEGGYMYVSGGPYNAREELVEHFPGADQEELEGGVSRIEDEGYEWVKKGEY